MAGAVVWHDVIVCGINFLFFNVNLVVTFEFDFLFLFFILNFYFKIFFQNFYFHIKLYFIFSFFQLFGRFKFIFILLRFPCKVCFCLSVCSLESLLKYDFYNSIFLAYRLKKKIFLTIFLKTFF